MTLYFSEHLVKSTHLLAIDSSSSCLTVGVFVDGQLQGQIQEMTDRNHSVILMPKIKQLLDSLQLRTSDFNVIAVGTGPGSYTGVRIGVAVAKTLAWAHASKVIGVSSLAAFALGASRHWLASQSSASHVSGIHQSSRKLWVVPMFHARRGQVFTSLYEMEAGRITSLVTDHIGLLDSWLDELQDRSKNVTDPHDFQIVFVASEEEQHVLAHVRERMQSLPKELIRIATSTHHIEAHDVGILAYLRWIHGDVDDVHALVPNYTQLAEAEVNYEMKIRMQRGES